MYSLLLGYIIPSFYVVKYIVILNFNQHKYYNTNSKGQYK